MSSIDDVIRKVPPGGSIVVRAATLGMSEKAFHRLATELAEDGGADDCDFVKAHRLGETGWGALEDKPDSSLQLIDAVTLRRHKR
ncbi:MAG: hypothetical protein EOP80_06325 [Variovorax sp.]|nr:MAG: hypothetical protein EOP80_06325 [Variovorax sp.]